MKNGDLSNFFFSRVGLRTYQHPCKDEIFISVTFISLVEGQKLLDDFCSLSVVLRVSGDALVWYLEASSVLTFSLMLESAKLVTSS